MKFNNIVCIESDEDYVKSADEKPQYPDQNALANSLWEDTDYK